MSHQPRRDGAFAPSLMFILSPTVGTSPQVRRKRFGRGECPVRHWGVHSRTARVHPGHGTMDTGHRSVDPRPRTLDPGHGALDLGHGPIHPRPGRIHPQHGTVDLSHGMIHVSRCRKETAARGFSRSTSRLRGPGPAEASTSSAGRLGGARNHDQGRPTAHAAPNCLLTAPSQAP